MNSPLRYRTSAAKIRVFMSCRAEGKNLTVFRVRREIRPRQVGWWKIILRLRQGELKSHGFRR